jgi:hypothetical protein
MSEIRASRRKHHIIYKTTCLVTGRFYIGMHSTDDLTDTYLGSGIRLRRSVEKHGADQHRREILEDLPTRDAASDREKEIITLELRADPLCLNSGPGGLGAVDRSATKDETRQRLSEKSKAVWDRRRAEGYIAPPQTPASIAKRVAKNIGKKRTPEQLANLHAGQAGYYSSVDPAVLKERGQRGLQKRIENGTDKLGGRPKGIPMSDEQKARQSAMSRGKSFSEEHKTALKKPKTRISCWFCRKETTVGGLARYHGACT